MPTPNDLSNIRRKIDLLDDKIVPLLIERINLALAASNYKNTEVEIRSSDRVKEVLDRVAVRAANAGGHEESAKRIYMAIIAELTDLQLKKKGV